MAIKPWYKNLTTKKLKEIIENGFRGVDGKEVNARGVHYWDYQQELKGEYWDRINRELDKMPDCQEYYDCVNAEADKYGNFNLIKHK